MPYIATTTSVKITTESEKELSCAYAEILERVAGKSREWLMLSFKDEERMSFRGESASVAILEVSFLGQFTEAQYDALTDELCAVASKTLGVPKNRIYIKYSPTETWGYNGFNF